MTNKIFNSVKAVLCGAPEGPVEPTEEMPANNEKESGPNFDKLWDDPMVKNLLEKADEQEEEARRAIKTLRDQQQGVSEEHREAFNPIIDNLKKRFNIKEEL